MLTPIPSSPYESSPKWGFGLALGLLISVLLFFAIRYWVKTEASALEEELTYEYDVPPANVHIFKGLTGPANISTVLPEGYTSWHNYETSGNTQIAILLTDTASSWLGLAQGLASAGLPFCITTSLAKALTHPMVMIYPSLRSNYFSEEEIKQLAQFSRKPSQVGQHPVLCAFGMTGGGLEEAFGVSLGSPSKTRFEVKVNNKLPISNDLVEPEELAWRLGDSAIYKEIQSTLAYQITGTATYPLVNYGSNAGIAVSFRQLDTGPRLLAWGIDLGDYVLRNYNGRDYEGYKAFVNAYEPAIDVLFRLIKRLYQDSNPAQSVTLWPVPDAKGLELNISHDVDFTKSIVNGVKYAQWEKSAGITATYFIQTKYIKDWNDDLFLNDLGGKCIGQINDLGMEVSSHSVSHSYVYKNFLMGDGAEQYPSYQPFVMERYKCYNGSVLGELRVSRFLVQHFAPSSACESFRPGHLSNPLNLPEAMQATGFKYSSIIPACVTQGYRPFFTRYGRGRKQQLPVVELPIAIEDEKDGPMINRIGAGIRLAKCIAKYGGYLNALIHTDTLGQKLQYEQQLVEAVRPFAHITTVAASGAWYRTWLGLRIEPIGPNSFEIISPDKAMCKGITIQTPVGYHLDGNGIKKAGHQNLFILPTFQSRLQFSVKPD